jgi:hypothetical protein
MRVLQKQYETAMKHGGEIAKRIAELHHQLKDYEQLLTKAEQGAASGAQAPEQET